MKTKNVTFQDEELKAAATVKQATLLDGMRRGELISDAFTNPDPNNLRQTARVVIYPVLAAGTVAATLVLFDHDGAMLTLPWPDFNSLLQLPETFVSDWLQAIYDLNPHWLPAGEQNQASAEKKAS